MHALRQLVRMPVGAVALAGLATALTACGSATVSGNTGLRYHGTGSHRAQWRRGRGHSRGLPDRGRDG